MRTLATHLLAIILGVVGAGGTLYALHRGSVPTPAPAPVAPSIVVSPPGGVRLHLDGGPFDAVAWSVIRRDLTPAPVTPDGPDAEVDGSPDPSLALAAYSAGNRLGLATATIPGSAPTPPAPTPGPTPQPTPGPPPQPTPPPPDPAPKLGRPFYAVAVFDMTNPAALKPGHREIRASGAEMIGPQVAAMGGHFHVFGLPVAPTAWSDAAQKVGFPALVHLDATGKGVVDARPLPDDSAGILAVTRQLLGH